MLPRAYFDLVYPRLLERATEYRLEILLLLSEYKL
jgi:hypothetical protein